MTTAREPENVHRLWTERFRKGDLDALVSLYEPEATFAVQPEPVRGTAVIREALAGFLAMRRSFELELGEVRRSGDIALLGSRWTLEGVGPDGAPIHRTGRTADVVRRQPDGSWKLVIDDPSGGGP